MQAIMETLFDIVYLCTVITLGILMIRKAKGHKPTLLFGIMAVTLGCGDAFHLVPRAFALCTDGLANHSAALGVRVSSPVRPQATIASAVGPQPLTARMLPA